MTMSLMCCPMAPSGYSTNDQLPNLCLHFALRVHRKCQFVPCAFAWHLDGAPEMIEWPVCVYMAPQGCTIGNQVLHLHVQGTLGGHRRRLGAQCGRAWQCALERHVKANIFEI